LLTCLPLPNTQDAKRLQSRGAPRRWNWCDRLEYHPFTANHIHLGPEVIEQALRILEVINSASPDFELSLKSYDFGGIAIDRTGLPLPDETLQGCSSADAVLLGTYLSRSYPSGLVLICSGAVGGPKWEKGSVRPEQGLLKLRKSLGLYANIRPANFASESLVEASPLKPEIARGVSFIVVRELIGGLYFGDRKEFGTEPQSDTAWDTMIYSEPEVQRITRVAAKIALTSNPPLEIHSIDKANVLASSRLWRRVVTETLTKEFPTLKFDHSLVDSAAMVMVSNPRKLNGVIVTENMFGDM
jgi:3-isopropylmalate dehydrogenase